MVRLSINQDFRCSVPFFIFLYIYIFYTSRLQINIDVVPVSLFILQDVNTTEKKDKKTDLD